MSWNSIDALAMPQVPYLDGVILAPCCYMVTIGVEVDTKDGFEMALHEHNTPACPQIPHTSKGIKTPENTIRLNVKSCAKFL